MRRELYEILWGATWGNNTAWLESLIVTGLAVWGLRDHIGKHAAAWWAKHHGPHAVRQHLEAMRQHEAKRATGKR
jgi:hypothetical protein